MAAAATSVQVLLLFSGRHDAMAATAYLSQCPVAQVRGKSNAINSVSLLFSPEQLWPYANVHDALPACCR